MSGEEARIYRNERISYLNGVIAGLKLGNECGTAGELDSKLEQYRKEINRIHEQLEAQSKETKV